jgi:hypothetical protein
MIRSLVCSLLFLLTFSGSHPALPASPSSSPIQGTLGQPLPLGPWQVTVQRAYMSHWEDTSVLEVLVALRNTSATSQPLVSTAFFTCYRADVWQSLPFLGSHPLLPTEVPSGSTGRATVRYQLPPGVLSFGLVFFWQAPAGDSATGIWLLQLREDIEAG